MPKKADQEGYPQIAKLFRAAAAAERLLADRVLGHLEEVVADRLENVPRLFQESHPARRVARVVERDDAMVVGVLVERQRVASLMR